MFGYRSIRLLTILFALTTCLSACESAGPAPEKGDGVTAEGRSADGGGREAARSGASGKSNGRFCETVEFHFHCAKDEESEGQSLYAEVSCMDQFKTAEACCADLEEKTVKICRDENWGELQGFGCSCAPERTPIPKKD